MMKKKKKKIKVLVITPGMYKGYLTEQIYIQNEVRLCQLPMPTKKIVMEYMPKLEKDIEHFQPDVLISSSQGGYYVLELWKRNTYISLPTLMLNCFGDLEEFPSNNNNNNNNNNNMHNNIFPQVIIVHGKRDPSATIEKLKYLQNTAPINCRVEITEDGHLLKSLIDQKLIAKYVHELAILPATKGNTTNNNMIYKQLTSSLTKKNNNNNLRRIEHNHPPVYDRRSGELYEYDKLGRVPYVLAATVICLRRRKQPFDAIKIYEHDLAIDKDGGNGSLPSMFMNNDTKVLEFSKYIYTYNTKCTN